MNFATFSSFIKCHVINRSPIASVQEVIDSGIVPKILEMTTWEDNFKFQVSLRS